MPYVNGLNRYISYHKRFFTDIVENDLGYSWIFMFRKHIMEFILQCMLSHLVGINIYGLFIKKIKSPYVIKTRNMVFVRMGINHCVKFFYACPKHLVTKIR